MTRRRERPPRPRPDHGGAKADRGQVALPDPAHTNCDTRLSGAERGLVRVQDRARVADRRTLYGVLGGERRTEKQGSRPREQLRLVYVRADDRRVTHQEILIVAVPGCED